MALVKLGIPQSVAKCFGSIWDNTVHQVKTIFGTSSPSYTSAPSQHLYSMGQGSTCGPGFYTLCYWLMICSLDSSITAAHFSLACGQILLNMIRDNPAPDSPMDVIQRLTHLAQHWEHLVH